MFKIFNIFKRKKIIIPVYKEYMIYDILAEVSDLGYKISVHSSNVYNRYDDKYPTSVDVYIMEDNNKNVKFNDIKCNIEHLISYMKEINYDYFYHYKIQLNRGTVNEKTICSINKKDLNDEIQYEYIEFYRKCKK